MILNTIIIVGTLAILSQAMRLRSAAAAPQGAEATATGELDRPVELSSDQPLSTEYEPNYQNIDISATWDKDKPVLEPQGGDFGSLSNSVNQPRELKPTEPKFHSYKPEWDEKQFPVKMDKSKYVTGKLPVQQKTEGLFDSPEIEDLRENLRTSDETLVKRAKAELGCDHGQSIQAIKEVSEKPINPDDAIKAIDASASLEPEAPPPVEAENGVVIQQKAPRTNKVQLDISHRSSGSELWDEVARFANKLPEEPTPVENKVGDVAQAAKLTAAAAAEKGSFLVVGKKAHESESTKASNSGSPSAKSRKKNCDPRAYTKDKPYQPCYQPDWVDPKMPETKH